MPKELSRGITEKHSNESGRVAGKPLQKGLV
jgi:hypothetical protein